MYNVWHEPHVGSNPRHVTQVKRLQSHNGNQVGSLQAPTGTGMAFINMLTATQNKTQVCLWTARQGFKSQKHRSSLSLPLSMFPLSAMETPQLQI